MPDILYLFDIDDTLLTTRSKIVLRDRENPDKIAHRLSSGEYRDWKGAGKTEGFIVSYEEFTDPEAVISSLSKGKAAAAISLLREITESYPDIEIGILTARSSEEYPIYEGLMNFFRRQGLSDVNLDPSLIFAVNHPKYKLSGTDSEKKLRVILFLIKEDIFDEITLVDDDPQHKKVIDSYCRTHHIRNVKVINL